jgi:two-component system chemotaxis response regulator CheV
MSKILKSVDMRTNLAGKNRMELLIFYLAGKQPYGINVFKVKEVYQNPKLTMIPKMHHAVVGVTHFRGRTIPVIDLSRSLGMPALPTNGEKTVITSEFNRKMQGLLVGDVHRIVNINWEDIHAPPKGSGEALGSYIIAITEVDGQLVEVIDVEKVLEEISPQEVVISDEILEDEAVTETQQLEVLIADDSLVARKKVSGALEALGCKITAAKTGAEAWDTLLEIADSGENPAEKFLMLISDIEMPEMDGYTLVKSIRADARMEDLYIAMHSSMSGEFNEAMIERVGANEFQPKFEPDAFAQMVMNRMRSAAKKKGRGADSHL